MVWHVVLLTPRQDLPAVERRHFADTFRRAVRSIPSVRGVRFGRRVTHGAGYERQAPEAGAFLAIVEFADRAGLAEYLAHPSHDELGAVFGQSLSSALVYDFEMLAENSVELREVLELLIEES